MIIPFFIDMYPDEYTTWDDWHSAVAYPVGEQNLPYVPDEEKWKEFARAFEEVPAFAVYGLDSADHYDDWREWGRDLLTAVNGAVQ